MLVAKPKSDRSVELHKGSSAGQFILIYNIIGVSTAMNTTH